MLSLLVGQADPDPAAIIGPYGALVLALGAIGWLLRDRSRLIAQRDALFREVTETAVKTTTALEHVAPILEANTRALDRAGETTR